MRYKVRAAINEWDLMRLYPNSRPETEGIDYRLGYHEDPELTREGETKRTTQVDRVMISLRNAELPVPFEDLREGEPAGARGFSAVGG